MNDDEDSSFDTSGSYVSSESKKTPRSSKRKRKYEILVTPYLSRRRPSASSSKKKKNKHGLDIFFPNYLFSFVRKDSFERALTVIENEEYLTLEEINKSDKFNLNFELLNVELYPNRDLAILRVRDGTICPSSVLCFPNSENWESLERSIIVDPVCRSNSPIIDLLLYNSSFSPLTFKEFILYRMKNVMAVKAKIDNKSLILCANGKDAYTTRIMTNQVSKQNIISKTNEKRYQELEEKYLQFISPKILKDQRFNSHTVSPKKHNNIKEDEVTKKISVIKGKIRKSFIEDSEEEGEVEDRIKNKRTKLKVGKVQTAIKNSVKVVKDGNKVRKISNSMTPNSRTSLKKLTIDEDYDESRNRSPHNIRKLKINNELETEEEDRKLYQTKKGNEIARCKKNMIPKTKEERTSLKKLRIDEDFNKSRKTLPQNLRKVNKNSYLETEEDSEDDKDSDKEVSKLYTSKKRNEIANKKTIIPKTRNANTSLKKQIFDAFRKRSPCNLKEITKESELDNKLLQTKKNYENARSKLIMTPKTKEERLSLTKLKSGIDEKRISVIIKKSNKNVELEMEEQDNDEEEQYNEEEDSDEEVEYSEQEGEDSDEEASRLHKTKNTKEILNNRTITPKTNNNKISLTKRNFDESRRRSCRNFRKVKKNLELKTEEDSDEEDKLYQSKKDNKNVRSKQIVTLKTKEISLSPRKLKSIGDDKKLPGNVNKLNKKVQLETEDDTDKKVKIQYEIKKGNEITKHKQTMTSETNEESPLLRKLQSNTIWKSVSKDIKILSKKFSSETEEEVCVEEVNQTKRTDEIEKNKEVLIPKTNLKSRTEGFSDGDLAKSSKSKGGIKDNKDNETKKPNILATTKVESEKTSIIEKWNQYEDNSSKERRNLNSPKKIHYSCKKVTTMRSKVNVDRVTYKTISELNSEHDCVNTFGIIVNILKENNNICKWRIAVEIIDQTQEKPPLKIYLFLPQRALVSLNNVIKVHQVVELVGLKVGKFNRAITGRVFAANQIELYDSITGGNIEWRVSSPKLNESESTLEIITNLRRWFKDKHIQSEENVNKDQKQKLSSNTSQVAELDLGDIEHIPKRVLSPRKKNLNQEKDKPLQSKTKQKSIDTISSSVLNEKKSCLYNMLDEIVPRENIDEVKLLKISYLKFYELEDLTEDDKFNMVIEVVNIHRYDEVNLEVIQVRDGTRCTLPMLHIPIEKSWSIAKKKILCNPSYTSDSPVVDILCFESQPYLLTLQVGKCYRIYNCLVIKTQLSDSSNGMDRCVICVEGKDCEVKNTSKIKIPETCLRNKGEKKAAESSGLPSSVFRQSKDYPESLRPFKRDQSEKEKATTILIGKKQTAVQDLDSRTPSLIGKKQTAVQDLDSITPSLIGKKQTAVQDLDSRTPSLIDLDETDGIHADIPFGMAKEIDSMMREESALGLPVTLSEDIHLKNSGSDPTYSQFAIHANQRSKLFKTSTQTFQREPMVRTLSTINSNSAQHLESIDLLNVNPTVLNDNIVYSPDSMESLRLELDDDEISNKGRTDNNDNIDNDELSNAGSESILSHRYRDRCLIDLDLTDQNVMVINEKKNVNKEKILLEKKINTSSSSDLDIVELDENITPKKDNGSLSNSKNSSANKGSPNKFLNNPLKEQPKLLIHAMLEKNFKLPSRCFYKSGNREEDSSDNSSESEDDDEGPEDSSSFPLDSHNYITTVTDYPDIPVMSIRTFLEIRNTNSHCYTTIPLKLSPELEDGWEEKAVHCICFKCNKTYVLSDVNKIVSEESDNWPNQKVPVCPLDGCPLKSATASFHFEFEIKLVKFNLTCTALLVSKSAETFLDCSVMEFLNCAKKRKEVKSRLKHLFHQNKTENANIYIFNLTRKNMFDVSPSAFYIKDIQLK